MVTTLREYIQSLLSQGHTPEFVHQYLVREGFDSKEIWRAMQDEPEKSVKIETVHHAVKHYLLVVSVVMVFGLLVAAAVLATQFTYILFPDSLVKMDVVVQIDPSIDAATASRLEAEMLNLLNEPFDKYNFAFNVLEITRQSCENPDRDHLVICFNRNLRDSFQPDEKLMTLRLGGYRSTLQTKLGYVLGMQESMWYKTRGLQDAPRISEMEQQMIYNPKPNKTAFFSQSDELTILGNIDRLRRGKEIILPDKRIPDKISVFVQQNEGCAVYSAKRLIEIRQSLVDDLPTYQLTAHNNRRIEFHVNGAFDLYFLNCASGNYWISNLLTDQCFWEQDNPETCELRCSENNQWCAVQPFSSG